MSNFCARRGIQTIQRNCLIHFRVSPCFNFRFSTSWTKSNKVTLLRKISTNSSPFFLAFFCQQQAVQPRSLESGPLLTAEMLVLRQETEQHLRRLRRVHDGEERVV